MGGTGYTGVELLRLLVQHPDVSLEVITSRAEAGVDVAQIFPSLRGRLELAFSEPSTAALAACDVVFFATPHGVAMQQATALLAAGVKVIDLGADFRLKDAHVFQTWYGMEHSAPALLKEAVYGLPEINRKQIINARLVGMPGCYPTAIQLGYAPLLAEEGQGRPALIDTSALIADAKSGVSGAGRKAEVSILLAETADNFKAYGVDGHRHHPEIVQGLQAISGEKNIGLTFVPHLVPMIRGIHATLYARILPSARHHDFQGLFEKFYADEPFVDVMPPGIHPETRFVRGSNMVRLAVRRPGGGDMLVVLVVEDNLVKGASGQAVQCMNLMCGLPEHAGLTHIAVLP